MGASALLTRVRHRSGLTLRQLAPRASTSHSTLSAYEHGHMDPTLGTLERILRAAGSALVVETPARIRGSSACDRGDELVEVLELAAMFPARHPSRLHSPPFPAG